MATIAKQFLAAEPKPLPYEPAHEAALIPPLILEGLRGYGLRCEQPGGFLTAVLANDFIEAVCRADPQSLAALRPIAVYVYDALPSKCHGSYEIVREWLEGAR